MQYVVDTMKTLCEYFPGADEPLEYNTHDELQPYVITFQTTKSLHFKKFLFLFDFRETIHWINTL